MSGSLVHTLKGTTYKINDGNSLNKVSIEQAHEQK